MKSNQSPSDDISVASYDSQSSLNRYRSSRVMRHSREDQIRLQPIHNLEVSSLTEPSQNTKSNQSPSDDISVAFYDSQSSLNPFRSSRVRRHSRESPVVRSQPVDINLNVCFSQEEDDLSRGEIYYLLARSHRKVQSMIFYLFCLIIRKILLIIIISIRETKIRMQYITI